jgi:hypothetical protein
VGKPENPVPTMDRHKLVFFVKVRKTCFPVSNNPLSGSLSIIDIIST